jgi:hypothetical protein
MQIRVGYELIYECPQPTSMILMLNIHFILVSDFVIADRIIIAQGRDAADVPLSNTFGPNVLKSFKVWTDEVRGQ